jgi:hypothetical protein
MHKVYDIGGLQGRRRRLCRDIFGIPLLSRPVACRQPLAAEPTRSNAASVHDALAVRGLGDCGGAQAQALSDFGVHGAVGAGASARLSLSEQAALDAEI